MISSEDSEAHVLRSPLLIERIVFFPAQVPACFGRAVVPPAVSTV